MLVFRSGVHRFTYCFSPSCLFMVHSSFFSVPSLFACSLTSQGPQRPLSWSHVQEVACKTCSKDVEKTDGLRSKAWKNMSMRSWVFLTFFLTASMAFRCDSQAEPVSFSTADLGLLPCDVSLNAVSFEEIAPFLWLGFPNVEAVKISLSAMFFLKFWGRVPWWWLECLVRNMALAVQLAWLGSIGNSAISLQHERTCAAMNCLLILVVCDYFFGNGSIQGFYIVSQGPRGMGCH